MKCPACGSTRLRTYRTWRYEHLSYRQRICADCDTRFFTQENLCDPPVEAMKSEGRKRYRARVERETAQPEEKRKANLLYRKLSRHAREIARDEGRDVDEVRATLGLPPRRKEGWTK